jgi:polyvinyl alcohol dehydrogenase (cytochrome)
MTSSFCSSSFNRMRCTVAFLSTFLIAGLTAGAARAADVSGEALYNQYCATCHAAPVDQRTPSRAALGGYTANSIVHALSRGIMQPQGSALSDSEKILVGEFLAGSAYSLAQDSQLQACSTSLDRLALEQPTNWNGWGNGLNNQRFQSAAGTNITLENIDQLELAWAFGLENATAVRAQPSIIGDVMLVGSTSGTIYAFDIATGCTYWTFPANTEVRTSVTVTHSEALDRTLAVFADMDNRLYVVDALTGNKLWHADVDDNRYARSTGSPVVYRDRIFVPVSSTEVSAAGRPDHICCTFRGNVAAFNLNTGEKIWHTYVMEEAREVGTNTVGNPILAPSGAPIWLAPTIDPKRNRLYVGTGQNYTRPTTNTSDAVIAFDMDTGNMDWIFQTTANDAFTLACTGRGEHPNCPEAGPDIDIGAPVLLVPLSDGREILVAGTKGSVVFGLDPDNDGATLWETRIGRGSPLGGIHWGMTFVGDTLFAPVSDSGPPVTEGNPRQPGLHALDMKTGAVKWYAAPQDRCEVGARCSNAYSAPATATEDFVISGALNGHLFVHDQVTGEVIWEYNSLQDYTTINAVAARGGSFDATGPVLSGNYMVVNSGYATFGQIPGNVVLVFKLKD